MVRRANGHDLGGPNGSRLRTVRRYASSPTPRACAKMRPCAGPVEAFERICRARLRSDPADSDDIPRRKKRYLVASAMVVFAPAGLIYFAFGEPVAGSIPLGYSGFSAVSIAAFARTRSFGAFRTRQLLFILVLPFLLQVALGGFVPASAMIGRGSEPISHVPRLLLDVPTAHREVRRGGHQGGLRPPRPGRVGD